MGRRSKSSSFEAADPFRIRAFIFLLASELNVDLRRKKFGVSDLLRKLQLQPAAVNAKISAKTIHKWKRGEDMPCSENRTWIEEGFPHCSSWLKSDWNSTAISRFFSVMDIYGARFDDPRRSLEINGSRLTVGSCLDLLQKKWGPQEEKDRGYYQGWSIPWVQVRFSPSHLPRSYHPDTPLSLVNFMILGGPYIELTDDQFKEWAIDLASTALLVRSYYEGPGYEICSRSGEKGDYSALLSKLFFVTWRDWPCRESLRQVLSNYPEFRGSEDFHAEKLICAREIVQKELYGLGNDLAIVRPLMANVIKSRNDS